MTSVPCSIEAPRLAEVLNLPLRVDTSAVFPLTSERVWSLISDFNSLPEYHASIISSELSEAGMVREIGLTEDAGGGFVVERLVYFNEESREFSYIIIDLINCSFPLRQYQAYVKLEDVSESMCRLHWGSVFTVDGITDEEGEAIARNIYQGCFDGIRRALVK